MGRKANAWIQLLVAGLASLVGLGEKMHPPRLPRMRHEPTLERREDGSELVLKLPEEDRHNLPPDVEPRPVQVVARDGIAVRLHDTGLRPAGAPAA